MGRWGRRLLLGLLACCPLGAQAPPDDPGAMAGAEGAGQVAQKERLVFVAPFVNEGGAPLAFWAEGLTMIFAEEAEAKFPVTRIDTDPALHADFVTGKIRAASPADLRRVLTRVGGDTILVTRYSGSADQFKLTGEAFEAARPQSSFAKVEVTGPSPYVALRQYLEAWAPQLGATPAPAAGDDPAMAGGDPAMAEGAPAAAPEGPAMEPGMVGDMGMVAAPPPPPIQVVDYKIEHFCRGLAAWPLLDPGYTWYGNLDEAAVEFERQLVADPNFGLGYTAAALTQVSAQRINRGLEIQRAWTTAAPASPANYRNLGRVLEAAGRPGEALSAYRQATKAEGGPLAPDVLAVARLETATGKPEDAVKTLTGAVKQFPRQRAMQLALGAAQRAAGNPKAAAEAYAEAVRMDGQALDGYLGLIDSYLQQGYFPKAVETAREATGKLAREPLVWDRLAAAQQASGRADQALEAAQQAVKVAGNEARPYQTLGELLLAAGDYQPAEAAFRGAVQRDAAWNKPRRYLARTLLYAGQTDQAATLIQEALSRATVSDLPATALDAARVAFYGGQLDRATEMLQLADDFAPGGSETALLRAVVRLYQGDEATAWDEFAGCLDGLGPEQVSEGLAILQGLPNTAELAAGMVMAGYLFERAGQTDKAREQYRKYRVAQPKGFLLPLVTERLAATERRP